MLSLKCAADSAGLIRLHDFDITVLSRLAAERTKGTYVPGRLAAERTTGTYVPGRLAAERTTGTCTRLAAAQLFRLLA